jgi:hypothetical protein
VVPDLTPNYHVVMFNLPLKPDRMKKEDYTFEYIASELDGVLISLKIDSVACIVGKLASDIYSYIYII